MTIGPKLRRLISIVKQRASAHETTAREFFLTGSRYRSRAGCAQRGRGRRTLRRVLRPPQRETASARRRVTRQQMTEAPHNVLVVDDEFASLEVLALLLAGEGFRVVTASNGEEALLRLAEQRPVDLVITDYKMPKMDGSELCLEMLADPRLRAFPSSSPAPRTAKTSLGPATSWRSSANRYCSASCCARCIGSLSRK